MTLSSFGELAAKLMTAEADMKLAQEAAVEKACQMVEKWAKKAIGQYLPGYNWAQLKEATQEERVRLGYSANEPLLRTGELRDSIGHFVEREGAEVIGYVGTNDPVAKYHEYGTSRMPPRSFLGASMMAQERAIVEMTGHLFAAAMQGGPNFREMREMVSMLRELGRELKKVADEFLDTDDEETR
jgi:phage gpG-like protein